MKKMKKLCPLMLFLVMLFNICIVSADEKIDEEINLYTPMQIGETWQENGITYKVIDVLSVNWEKDNKISSNSEIVKPAAIIPITITVSIGYIGGGRINCIIRGMGGPNALLKYINGSISTWGVAGSHSAIDFSDQNMIPMSTITAEATFNFLYLLESGTQYTQTQGTVTDAYGNVGSFGPSVGSATIYP